MRSDPREVSASARSAAHLGDQVREAEARWVESLRFCRCYRPVRDRLYLGIWSCRVCRKARGSA